MKDPECPVCGSEWRKIEKWKSGEISGSGMCVVDTIEILYECGCFISNERVEENCPEAHEMLLELRKKKGKP
jgi:hypothetical protein